MKTTPAPCRLIGTDGNACALMAVASRCLRTAGRAGDQQPMIERIQKAQSYDETLAILQEYVTVDDDDDGE